MASDQYPGVHSFGRRLEKWVRDSAELRAWVQQARGLTVPATPEEAALRRYHQSRTRDVALPHPAVSPRRYDALNDRRRELVQRISAASLAVPLLVVLGVVVGPTAATLALWGLLVPLVALIVHHTRALARIDEERHLTLHGGLADAWADWVRARDEIQSLDGAAQARAALGANEARMEALVLALGRTEARPGHRDTDEHRASREWVYRTAAKAVALAQAERELEETTQLQIEAGGLRLAPEGDAAALDQALDAAREITRGMQPPPST